MNKKLADFLRKQHNQIATGAKPDPIDYAILCEITDRDELEIRELTSKIRQRLDHFEISQDLADLDIADLFDKL